MFKWLGTKIIRWIADMVDVTEKVNEEILNKFKMEVGDKEWKDLIESLRIFLAFCPMELKDKRGCFDYLLERGVIYQWNFDKIMELFPEFHERVETMRPFLQPSEYSKVWTHIRNRVEATM